MASLQSSSASQCVELTESLSRLYDQFAGKVEARSASTELFLAGECVQLAESLSLVDGQFRGSEAKCEDRIASLQASLRKRRAFDRFVALRKYVQVRHGKKEQALHAGSDQDSAQPCAVELDESVSSSKSVLAVNDELLSGQLVHSDHGGSRGHGRLARQSPWWATSVEGACHPPPLSWVPEHGGSHGRDQCLSLPQ